MKVSKRSVVMGRAVLVVYILVSIFSTCQKNNYFPQAGDLLFQDLDGSPFCDAVEKVTSGYSEANLTHVGIVACNDDNQIVVLEAIQEGVKATPLDTFLSRSHDVNGKPKVIVGRLKKKYRRLIKPALAEAFARVGKAYDNFFNIENDAYYCSELVYECFRIANSGKPLFILEPMTFKDPDTQAIFPAWQEYFAELNSPVPEGAPGLNPGSISRSPVLHIVHIYGIPGGYDANR